MSSISVIGTGYVGLVSGAILSDFGHDVICADIDEKKIERLNGNNIPIFEPQLEEYVIKNKNAGRLHFTTDLESAIKMSDVIFIAVGTPPREDGSADLRHVLDVAQYIGQHINGYKVIVNKSTAPVGTGEKVQKVIAKALKDRNSNIVFDIVSNPEFLREGSAVYDFIHPDRVVIGAVSQKALNIMKEVYRVLYINETPFVETNIETAEMIKYASNAFLAVKISYINEMANLCEKVGADIKKVSKAMGMDGRISSKFLHAGPGYGGSCFPKDTLALINIGMQHGISMSVVQAAITANKKQKFLCAEKVIHAYGSIEGKTLAVLGITFKPNTDDMRDAPSLDILRELSKHNVFFRICDPQYSKEVSLRLNYIQAEYFQNAYEAMIGCDGIIILTEWNEFRSFDFNRIKEITSSRLLFDFRNIYDRKYIENFGFTYIGVGV